MRRLPISPGVAQDEITSCVRVLQEWTAEVIKGIPMGEAPGLEGDLEDWLRNFRGELLYVADKLTALASRMTEIE